MITVLTDRKEEAEKAFQKLKKRADKYGIDFNYMFDSPRLEERRNADGKKYKVWVNDVLFRSDTVVAGDYEFLARIDAEEDGNFVNTVPGVDANPEWRHTDTHCDHCGTDRRRKSVFILQNLETGEEVQVGSACLRDYLGINPEQILRRFNFYKIAREFSGFGQYEWGADLEDVVALAVKYVDKYGYHKRDSFEEPTSYMVMDDLNKVHKMAAVTNEHRDKARRVIEWVRNNDSDSDYFHNLKLLFKQDVITQHRRIFLAVSAVPVYNRHVQAVRDAERVKDSEWVGGVGDRIKKLPAKITMIRELGDRGYGEVYLYKFETDDGNVMAWFSTAYYDMQVGDPVYVTATVKSLNEFKGIKETILTRAKLEDRD